MIQGVQLHKSFRRTPIHQKSSVSMKGLRIRRAISRFIRRQISGVSASSRVFSKCRTRERIMPVCAENKSMYGFSVSGRG